MQTLCPVVPSTAQEHKGESMRSTILACVFTALTFASISAQTVDESKIQAALELGLSGKTADIVFSCEAGGSFRQGVLLGATVHSGVSYSEKYDVQLATNLGRIAALAQDAKRMYKPFSRSNVPDAMLVPSVYIYVRPQGPSQSGSVLNLAPPLEHLVLKPKASDSEVLHPDSLAITTVEWMLGGGKWTGTQADGVFPIDRVMALPPGDFEIVLITEGGERRCKVSDKDRRKMGLSYR